MKYLRLGLAEVQKISSANDFYDPVFLYLSGGLERLFKCMLCLNFEDKHQRLPNPNEIWNNKNGHDLKSLKSKVEEICIPVSRPFAAIDFDLITKDEFINKVCNTLSAFGKRARYFNLDAILGVDQDFNAEREWGKMETMIGKEFYGEGLFYQFIHDPKQLDLIYSDTNREIVARLESFFRALTRQFIFGDFSSKSNKFLFSGNSFTDIKDEQLGCTDYREFEVFERIKR